MGVERDLSAVDNHTIIIDNSLAWAIENDSTSNLKPLYKETEAIRERTESLRGKFKAILQENTEFQKKLNEEKKMIWVELAYQLAPLILGVICLVIGRLTNDPLDTKVGIGIFFVGFLMTALHQTVGYWGIVLIGVLALGHFFFASEKRDIEKKQKVTTLGDLNQKGTS